MEEAPRCRGDVDLVAHFHHVESIEGLHRAVRLALRRSEGGEVMTSDEVRRPFAHRFDIERYGDMPHPPHVQRWRGAAAEDPIEIASAQARKARMPVIG